MLLVYRVAKTYMARSYHCVTSSWTFQAQNRRSLKPVKLGGSRGRDDIVS